MNILITGANGQLGNEMRITVLFFFISSMLFFICSVAMASRLAVGSSRKMIGGFFMNILAMATLCC